MRISMNKWFKSGKPYIWLTAGAVSVSLIAVLGLLALIAWRGLSFFWPAGIHEVEVRANDGSTRVIIGEVYDREQIPIERLEESGVALDGFEGETLERQLFKIGNREFVPLDFMWVMEPQIVRDETPADLAVLERSKDGNFYGYVVDVLEQGNSVADEENIREVLFERIERAVALNEKASD